MAGDVTGKGRGDEGGALVGPPIVGQNPANAGHVFQRVFDKGGAAPGVQFDLADVFATVAGQRVVDVYDFDKTGEQGDAVGGVVWQVRVGALAAVGQGADGRDGADVVVPALDTPGGDGGASGRRNSIAPLYTEAPSSCIVKARCERQRAKPV